MNRCRRFIAGSSSGWRTTTWRRRAACCACASGCRQRLVRRGPAPPSGSPGRRRRSSRPPARESWSGWPACRHSERARSAALAGVGTSVITGSCGGGRARAGGDAGRPALRCARRSSRRPRAHRRSEARGGRALPAHGGFRPFGHPHRRRHRFGQDGSLLRGHGRGGRHGPTGAAARSRNRPDPAVHRPGRRALRGEAGRVALRRPAAGTRAGVAGGSRRRGPGPGRRTLGAVPAVAQARPHRRR